MDDETLVREALAGFFSTTAAVEVVGEARDGLEAVQKYEKLRPDVVLMDLQMPRLTGIEAIGRICVLDPAACIVAMTTFGTREYIVAALRAGASGYLLKDARGSELLAALDAARAGEMPLSPGVRRRLVSSLVGESSDGASGTHGTGNTGNTDDARSAKPTALTPRELEVTQWLAHGLSNGQIATRMHLSEGSVKQHLTKVAAKLGVGSRTQVLVRSIQLGFIDPSALPPLGS